jgi:NAD(P)-dependent dehydrogenase (short-subunit alcohol dehydrogenase family)
VATSMSTKTALVTGAGSGIGRATAVAFARAGANVVLADVDVAGGQATLALIESLAGQGHFVAADVSKSSEVERLIKTTVED